MGRDVSEQRRVDLTLDEDGHLADPRCWSEPTAQKLAAIEGIELGPDHWREINATRDFYLETGVSPSMRPLVRLVRDKVGADSASSLALMRLFPGSPARRVAKIAGLPRPDKCL